MIVFSCQFIDCFMKVKLKTLCLSLILTPIFLNYHPFPIHFLRIIEQLFSIIPLIKIIRPHVLFQIRLSIILWYKFVHHISIMVLMLLNTTFRPVCYTQKHLCWFIPNLIQFQQKILRHDFSS